ncbi:MAG: hypothetical protein U0S36_00600 [Candidatus Nanopelagicales bacterium]
MVVPPEGIELDEDSPWDPWTPQEVAARLRGCPARWYVVAGWGVDVAAGRVTREHSDLEIAVARDDFPLVRAALADLEPLVVGAGRGWPVDSPAYDEHFQTWFRDPSTGLFHVDVFRDPHEGGTWICRRDPAIRRPYAEVLRRSDEGIPYLAPECILLFKAKHGRPKDEADLATLLPLLDPDARDWLAQALARVHPGHPWIERVSAGAS